MFHKTKQILRQKGYKLYTQPFQLNIVAYRNKVIRSNVFDDEIHVFFKNDIGKWIYYIFQATTDPGQYWLDNPLHPQGTAFLQKGQYIDAYALGLHRGLSEALVQVKPVTVIRDYDRSGLFKWFENGIKDQGLFGINIHKAKEEGVTKIVDSSSAGCLVFSNPSEFEFFMRMAKVHRSLHGNQFTVTLVDFRDERRRNLSLTAWTSLIASSVAGVANAVFNNDKHETI